MSGTSLDGIDVALLDLSGKAPLVLATHFQSYPQSVKNTLLTLHQPTTNELHNTQLISIELAYAYAAATQQLLKKFNFPSNEVRAIGCHGQTIRHRPDAGYTIQLGNAALLAELSGITVVSDFRSRDIAAGGQGAPLVPAFHHKMMRHPDIHRVIVNIGGISNLTNLSPISATTGFDCGPGNLLMDTWVMRHLNQPYDNEGKWATTGAVVPSLLKKLLDEPYLHAQPPKSCGRDLFNMDWLDKQLSGFESAEDVQATLLALTCLAISDSIHQCCAGAQEIYLCGGGAHNLALIKFLKCALPECTIQLTDVLGIESDWLEAIAFAWLAQQSIQGDSSNLPEVTGARHPCILGAIYQA